MHITQTPARSPRAAKAGLLTGRRRAAAIGRKRLRPEWLRLETRQLLATFVVTNPADTLTGGVPTPNTLRWAVDQADPVTPLRDRHRSGKSTELFGRSANLTLNPGPSLSRQTITPDPGHGRVGWQTGECRTGP
jgi:hypothetical protein